MKKIALGLTIFTAALVLAGCSLAPAAPTNTPPNPDNSIWTSGDSGKTWVNNYPASSKTDISGADVISMAINPFDAKNVYVGLRGQGILKTDDGGQTWDYLKFQSQKVYGLDLDPSDGRIIYASGVWQNRGKIFKSTDSGANWSEIYTTAANGPLVIALTIDKNNGNTIYASTSDNQLIKSTDGGTSWKNIFSATSPMTKIALDKFNSNLIYLITVAGDIFQSKDGGKSFINISQKLAAAAKNNQSVSVVETDPSNASWVYVAGTAGLLRSKDAGQSWEKIGILSNAQNFPVKAIAINPANSNEIIYGAAQAAYRSLDGGQNWATFQFNLAKNVNVIKYSAADPTQAYLGFAK